MSEQVLDPVTTRHHVRRAAEALVEEFRGVFSIDSRASG
jgi:hypothetical protein